VAERQIQGAENSGYATKATVGFTHNEATLSTFYYTTPLPQSLDRLYGAHKINFHQTQGRQWKCQKVKLLTGRESDFKTKTQEDSTSGRHTLRCHAPNMKK
jgi:hypothetical protein